MNFVHCYLEFKTVFVLQILVLSFILKSDAQSFTASGNLENNGNVAFNFRPQYTVVFSSDVRSSCSWKRNTETAVTFYNLRCFTNSSLAPSNITCAQTGTNVVSTFLPPAVIGDVTVSLQCIPAISNPNYVLTAKYCGNTTVTGVHQDVPPNQGYSSTHTFRCITPNFVSGSKNSTCQANATWDLTSFCAAADCNDATVPSNSSYITPTSGTTLHMNTLTLQCAGNYTGSAFAICTDVDVWNVTSSCTPSCNQSTIPTDASYSHSGTSVSLVNEVVTLTCNNGYTGNAEATCIGPGQWSVTTTCSVTTTPAATTTSAGATAFGSFWNGTPLVMLFVSAICNHF